MLWYSLENKGLKIMLKKNIKKLILETLKEKPEELCIAIGAALDELMTDEPFLRKVGKSLDVHEARRLELDIERQIEELSAKEQEMRHSSTPWFEWVCLGVHPDKGEKLKYEYNAAWIKHMGDIGIPGKDADEKFMTYVSLLSRNSLIEGIDELEG
jgi:hypothetical protein